MLTRVKAYVLATAALAVGGVVLLARFGGTPASGEFHAALAFAILGLVCQAYMYQMHRTAAGGTLSFIPVLTAAAVSPSWSTQLLVAGAVATGELIRRPQALRGFFNVAQYTLATAVATIVFLMLGGQSLRTNEAFEFLP